MITKLITKGNIWVAYQVLSHSIWIEDKMKKPQVDVIQGTNHIRHSLVITD